MSHRFEHPSTRQVWILPDEAARYANTVHSLAAGDLPMLQRHGLSGSVAPCEAGHAACALWDGGPCSEAWLEKWSKVEARRAKSRLAGERDSDEKRSR